jgi:predicted aspartyl protease
MGDCALLMRIAVLFVALLGAGLSTAQAAGDCRLKQVASIPITIGPSGRILLEASINDQPVKLLLDTGASFSLLDRSFVQRAGLPLIDTRTLGYGLTGRGINQGTRVGTLKLGTAVSRDGDFAVGDSTGGRDGGVGLFGADYLSNYDIEIDLAARRVVFYAQDHCPGQVVYWAKEYFRLPLSLTRSKRPDADIAVDGKPLRALIDTGASGNAMRLSVARRLFDIAPDAEGVQHRKATGIDGTVDGFNHVFDSLTFGDITLRNTNVAIESIDVGKGAANAGSHMLGTIDQEDILIGMTLLRKLHLFIAYSESALYFTIAEPRK